MNEMGMNNFLRSSRRFILLERNCFFYSKSTKQKNNIAGFRSYSMLDSERVDEPSLPLTLRLNPQRGHWAKWRDSNLRRVPHMPQKRKSRAWQKDIFFLFLLLYSSLEASKI